MELITKSKKSSISIGDSIIDTVGEVCKKALKSGKVAVVTDSNVAQLYAERVLTSIKNSGLCAELFTIPAGEEYKTLNTVSEIYAFLAKNKFSRSDLIIALGGGVVGDIVGFAAATYLRGIRSIQVPTTLLAQVDSSVGGKCGVDLPYGKNLIGAFNQPDYVIIDTTLPLTLPDRIFRDGLAEVIKYGCIFDEALFKRLEKEEPKTILSEIVERCVELKAGVVMQDELDRGERMLLNFGHTIGHGIEKCGNYTEYSHGQAVAIGMIYAARLGQRLNITPPEATERLTRILNKYGFEASPPYPVNDIIESVKSDKKILDGKLNFIILKEIGSAVIYPMTFSEIKANITNTVVI